LCAAGLALASAAPAGRADPEPVPVSVELAPTVLELLAAIESLSDYRAGAASPPIFLLPQHRIEQRVCESPCNVRAAYLPRDGIYLSANLDPVRDPLDRSALLHELVHYLQQGHPRFDGMDPCARERAKEQEAYAIQNAYLASVGHPGRVVFYDDFDCDDGAVHQGTSD
jgi:hypothetical protein